MVMRNGRCHIGRNNGIDHRPSNKRGFIMAYIVSGAIHHPDEVIDYIEKMEFEYGDLKVVGIVWHEGVKEHRVYLKVDLSMQDTRMMPAIKKLPQRGARDLTLLSQQVTQESSYDLINKA